MTRRKKDRETREAFIKEDEQLALVDKSLEQELIEEREVECLGQVFPNDTARRAHFLELLEEKLRDPEFRATPGFPKAEDEDILRLSDPPYYTACPNPFLEDFVRFHSSSRADRSHVGSPISIDVKAGKNDSIYAAHSYHTKVPPAAILQLILHYTSPGDLVLDGFAGTGMTGIACSLAARPSPSLRAEMEGRLSGIEWGARSAVLCDLSPLASFIGGTLNRQSSHFDLLAAWEEILQEAEGRYGQLFETRCSSGDLGVLQYAVWTDEFLCPACQVQFSLWEASVDLDAGAQRDPFECPACTARVTKRSLERAFETTRDLITGELVRRPAREICWLNVKGRDGRESRPPNAADLALATKAENLPPDYWIPLQELTKGERYFKDGLHLVALDYTHRFYFPRTLLVLSFLWQRIEELRLPITAKNRLRAVLTSMLDRNLTIRNRFVINRHNPRGRVNGPLANTLYVPGLSVEQNPLEALAYKARSVLLAQVPQEAPVAVSVQDSSGLPASLTDCVDYVFVDPPFGHNIMYSELNEITESWLRVFESAGPEAVVSAAQEKGIDEYRSLMLRCFSRFYTMLKPGRWMTVEFHNSSNAVWNSIREAIEAAGFVIAEVRTLDKKKGTINQEFYRRGTVKTDLLISAYKPSHRLTADTAKEGDATFRTWVFVDEYLKRLPLPEIREQAVRTVADRTPQMLFDRLVSTCVQSGSPVPLSATEFYAALAQRYPERDGMFFLSEQVAAYDRRRARAEKLQQLELFVSDEASAIQWVRQQLSQKPQSFQDLQPQFMKELQAWAKHEQTVELQEILEQGFLQYDGKGPVPPQIHSYLSTQYKTLRGLEKDDPGLRARAMHRWYVPDAGKAGDLEKLRARQLLKEFETYKAAKKKLKQFRTEAVRAGFKAAYDEDDYETIIEVAEKIPEAVLQEDEKLLMYYDVALMRKG